MIIVPIGWEPRNEVKKEESDHPHSQLERKKELKKKHPWGEGNLRKHKIVACITGRKQGGRRKEWGAGMNHHSKHLSAERKREKKRGTYSKGGEKGGGFGGRRGIGKKGTEVKRVPINKKRSEKGVTRLGVGA